MARHGLVHQKTAGVGLNSGRFPRSRSGGREHGGGPRSTSAPLLRSARARPDGSTGAAIVLSLLVVASASPQAIQQWKTPDGSLFFGDRPPAGSIKVGVVGDDPKPPEPVLSAKAFAAKASQSRNELESALRRSSDRLWDIRDQLDKVEKLKPKDDPEFVMSEQEAKDLAAFQTRKAETLRRLREAERTSWSAIATLWKSLDELSSKVASRYGGKSPEGWPGKIDCPNCASREDAENALK
jgi:hypothetical protein